MHPSKIPKDIYLIIFAVNAGLLLALLCWYGVAILRDGCGNFIDAIIGATIEAAQTKFSIGLGLVQC